MTEDQAVIEIERQVTQAVERYREVVLSMDAGGRPPTGQQAAVKAVGRALQLVIFVLKRAADASVGVERLGELTGWEPDAIRELLERPETPAFVRRVAAPGVDAGALTQAVASVDAQQTFRTLVDAILEDLDAPDWSPAAADVDDLGERVEHVWRQWQQRLGRQDVAGRQ